MKIKITKEILPFVIKITGGATYEPNIGWWTFFEGEFFGGETFLLERDAVYIPTLQRDGVKVDLKMINLLTERAIQLGLNKITRAKGLWVNDQGKIDEEEILICSSEDNNFFEKNSENLLTFLGVVKDLTFQDDIAWEDDGILKIYD